ncbi:MAG: hypothetical protein IIB65_10080 [Proteobacteria bacterium]|nr:hypothetical protein [Pseudomonadota bacterium]
MSKSNTLNRKSTAMLLGSAAALAIMAGALPAAMAASLDAPVQLAASHPCNPCAAKNPCGAKTRVGP